MIVDQDKHTKQQQGTIRCLIWHTVQNVITFSQHFSSDQAYTAPALLDSISQIRVRQQLIDGGSTLRLSIQAFFHDFHQIGVGHVGEFDLKSRIDDGLNFAQVVGQMVKRRLGVNHRVQDASQRPNVGSRADLDTRFPLFIAVVAV